jgi:mechanosensitive ion channel-like protein
MPLRCIMATLLHSLFVYLLEPPLLYRVYYFRFMAPLLAACFAWLVSGIAGRSFDLAVNRSQTQDGGGESILVLMQRLSRIVMLIIALVAALAMFGINVKTKLAGLGIGGLALALSAQKSSCHYILVHARVQVSEAAGFISDHLAFVESVCDTSFVISVNSRSKREGSHLAAGASRLRQDSASQSLPPSGDRSATCRKSLNASHARAGNLQNISRDTLINASSAFPIDDVNQFPLILRKLKLKLSLFVDSKLALWIENAAALFLVGIVDIELAGGKVEGLRLRVRIDFAHAELAVSDPADLASGGSGDHADITDVVAESTGDGAVANGLPFGECVDQATVLAFFKGGDEELVIIGCREVVDFNTDTDDLAELGACAHGARFDGFILDPGTREKGKGAHRQECNEHQSSDGDLGRVGIADSFCRHFLLPFDRKGTTKSSTPLSEYHLPTDLLGPARTIS